MRLRDPAPGMRAEPGNAIARWSGPSGTLSLWPSARGWLTRRFGRLVTRRTAPGGAAFGRIAGHLAGYGTLLAYIWHQRRTQKQSAG